MGDLLKLEELIQRVRHYIEMRKMFMIPGLPYKKQSLRSEAFGMLQEVLIHGSASRGKVIHASRLKERTGRNLLGMLLEEGLLVSDSPKGEVRLGFPIHAARWFFPELYPTLMK